jgi:hypothetical protein
VTAEATASYVINIRSLAPAFQQGQCLTSVIHFDRGKFPVVVTADLTTEWNCSVELIHKTRDYREGDRIVIGRVEVTWTTPTYGGRRWWFLCPRTAVPHDESERPPLGAAIVELRSVGAVLSPQSV